MSNLTVNQLTATDPTTNLINVAAGDTVYSPGSVVQVVNTTIYTPTAVAVPADRNVYTNVPDLVASIVPKKSTSRIYIMVRWFGEFSIVNTTWDSMFGIKRNGTAIGLNPTDAGGSRGITSAGLNYYAADGNSTPEICMFDYLDSPSTASAITYQVYLSSTYASTMYTNRTVVTGFTYAEAGSSSITLWEIAQ
jgi:hypothetical protein